MTASAETGLVTMLAIVGGLGLLIGIAVYVWYALALSRLFPRIGGEGWKGWVPILNEAEILARGGVPAWSVVFYFIPIVQLYGLYLKVVATHRINGRFGRGAGMTVLAILLPPVWATVLAWGAAPYPEGERLAALQPEPRRGTPPSAAPARDASGYTIPSLAPHNSSPSEAPGLIFPDYAAPPRPAQPVAAPDSVEAGSAAPAAAPSVWGAPPQPPVAGAPFAPGAPAASFAPPASPAPAPDAADPAAPTFASPAGSEPPVTPAAPAQPFAPQPPAFVAPQPSAPSQPSAPPIAPPVVPLPHVSSEAPQFSGHAEFDAYAAEPAASAPAADGADAHPATGIMATMGGEPSAPQASSTAAPTPAPAIPAPDEMPADVAGTEDQQIVPPAAPQFAPPQRDPAAESHDSAAESPSRAVRPVPPSFRDADSAPVAPQAPSIRPAPSSVSAQTPAPSTPPVPTTGVEGGAVAGLVDGGLVADVDKTVVTPRPTDDDLDATVVVARRRGVRRSLVLDDGRTFALSGASVVIGRNPIGDPGEQRLAISDTTRTLSKTHARLVVHDDEWRLTDLNATNGVVVVEENGTETLLDPGESVTGNGRFILGEVGMHVVAERDS